MRKQLVSLKAIRSGAHIPPYPHGFVYALAKWLLVRPALLLLARVPRIEYEPAELRDIKALNNARLTFVANHVASSDAMLAFHAGIAVRRKLFILSTRENFDQVHGWFGWLIQQCGAYSLKRGAFDKQSLAATKTLLQTRASSLFIFPEGGAYSRSDLVFPFIRPAIGQIVKFSSIGADSDILGECHIVPVALKYRFTRPMKKKILRSLAALEQELGVEGVREANLYKRLQVVAELTLCRLERHFMIPQDRTISIYERLETLKRNAVVHIQYQIGGEAIPEGASGFDTLRRLHDRFVALAREGDYRLMSKSDPLTKSFERLKNWIAVSEGYLSDRFDTNRVVDLLYRIEEEVFDRGRIKGKRVAIVRFGSPISIRNREYSTESIEQLTVEIESCIQDLLNQAVI